MFHLKLSLSLISINNVVSEFKRAEMCLSSYLKVTAFCCLTVTLKVSRTTKGEIFLVTCV